MKGLNFMLAKLLVFAVYGLLAGVGGELPNPPHMLPIPDDVEMAYHRDHGDLPVFTSKHTATCLCDPCLCNPCTCDYSYKTAYHRSEKDRLHILTAIGVTKEAARKVQEQAQREGKRFAYIPPGEQTADQPIGVVEYVVQPFGISTPTMERPVSLLQSQVDQAIYGSPFFGGRRGRGGGQGGDCSI